MTPEEEEALFVYFCELDTNDLLCYSVAEIFTLGGGKTELKILYEALLYRREEIDTMVKEMEDLKFKNRRTIKLPMELVVKLMKWESAHNNFMDS